MIILRYLFLPALLLIPTLAFSADLQRVTASSRIDSVTVYADRALVSRSATLRLEPGSYIAVFENLPQLVQDDSVRVTGKGSAGITIAGLEVKRAFLAQSGEQRVKEIDEEIRRLELRSAALDAKRTGLDSQAKFLDSIGLAWGDRISKELAIGRPTVAELGEAAGFVGAGVTKVAEQLAAVDAEKKKIKEDIDALRRRRESIATAGKETKTVEVMLDVTRQGEIALDLSTVVIYAGWVPSYDVHLAPDAITAELTFRAMVRQQTGEDWNDIDLTLSTARPAGGGAPPELHPWHISLIRPQPPAEEPVMYREAPAASAPMRAKGVLLEAAPRDMLGSDVPVPHQTAEISAGESSVSFHIPRRVTIPSDGSQHGSVVAVERCPVEIEFLAVPKLSPNVFLRSEIVNRAPYVLLPGKVNAFAGNTYTGSSYLKKTAAGEKFDLFFGADDQVTVKREELKQHKEAGIFGKNRVNYRYRIEMNNFRNKPVTVTFRDQLPLPADEEIKVSLDDPSVKPNEVGNDGRITWKLSLQPGEKKELTFGIVVEYPKDREIAGL